MPHLPKYNEQADTELKESKNAGIESKTKHYYSSITKYSCSDSESDKADAFYSFFEAEDETLSDYVPTNQDSYLKNYWKPIRKLHYADKNPPSIFDIPFVTSKNMRKLVFSPPEQKLNVRRIVRNMSALGQYEDITTQCQKPLSQILISKIFLFPFRPTTIFSS